MSRWGKPTKNSKARDPRYFLNEQQDPDDYFFGFEPDSNPMPETAPEEGFVYVDPEQGSLDAVEAAKDDGNPFGGMSDRSPAESAVEDKIYDLVDAIDQMGKSNPDLTDAYIVLFRALQGAGVNVNNVAMLAEGKRNEEKA